MRIVQIENNTHCNYACWFCQNRYYITPKKKIMSMDLFEHILKEVRVTGDINIISFSAYNEPTLDPLFVDRMRIMKEMGFYHLCAVNGSNINKEMVDTMVEERLGPMEIRINLPTVNTTEARKIMGITAQYHKKVLSRIDYLFGRMNEIEAPVKIMVNGNGSEDHKRTTYEVYEYFKHHTLEISMSGLVNRAGMLDHIIESKIDKGEHKSFNCCMNYFSNLYFGVKGNMYLCCHDYYQQYSFGNVNEKKLKDIIGSEEHEQKKKEFMQLWCRHCSESIVPRNIFSTF